MNFVCTFLVVHNHQNTTRVTELVFVSVHPDHFPRNTVVGTQECITVLVILQIITDASYAHHKTGCWAGEYTTKVMWQGH